MKKFFVYFLLSVFVLSTATSCRDDDYDYEIEKVPTFSTITKGAPSGGWKLYESPSVKSTVTTRVKGGGKLGEVKERHRTKDGILWYHIAGEYPLEYSRKGYKYDKGWIQAQYANRDGDYVTHKTEVTSRARIMEKAEQPIAHFILKTKEQIREKLPLDKHAMLLSLIYSVLIWVVYAVIRITKRVSVWHLVVVVIAVLIQYLILFTCDIYNMKGQIGNVFLDLIFGLLWLVAPLAQIWLIATLLSPILLGDDVYAENEDDDSVEDSFLIVKGHFSLTLLSVVILLGCYHFNKNWVDGGIIFCAVFQLIAFLVMLAVTEGKFWRTALYMPLFVFLALPTVYISLSSLAMAFAVMMVMTLLFSPIAGGKAAQVLGHRILDGYGHEVDRVESSGHSSETGKNYDIHSDGTAEER